LRDLSLKLGIKVLSHTSKDYILDNDESSLLNKLAQQVASSNEAKSQSKEKGKKKSQA